MNRRLALGACAVATAVVLVSCSREDMSWRQETAALRLELSALRLELADLKQRQAEPSETVRARRFEIVDGNGELCGLFTKGCFEVIGARGKSNVRLVANDRECSVTVTDLRGSKRASMFLAKDGVSAITVSEGLKPALHMGPQSSRLVPAWGIWLRRRDGREYSWPN